MSDTEVKATLVLIVVGIVLGLITVMAAMYVAGMATDRWLRHRTQEQLSRSQRRVEGYRTVAIHLAGLARAAGVDPVELERIEHMVRVAEQAAPVEGQGKHARSQGGVVDA